MSRAAIGDGATVQAGLGKIPTAALRALCGSRGLRIHSGLVSEAVVDLERGRRAGQRRRGDRRGRDWIAASLRCGRRPRLSLRAGRLHPFAAHHLGDRELCLDQFGLGGRSVRAGVCRNGPGRLDVGSGRRLRFRARRLRRGRPPDRRPACIGRQGRDQPHRRARARGPDLFRSAGWTPTSSSPSSAPPISAASATTIARRR